MRTAFGILVLGLLLATGWAAWKDGRPEWRRYQEELVHRETVRLQEELAAAREEIARPEIQRELAQLDDRIRAQSEDPSGPGPAAGELQLRLAQVERERDSLRTALRNAELPLSEGPAVRRRELLDEQLGDVQRRYAELTGSWPPDTLRMALLWAERDSLGDLLLEIEGPVPRMKEDLEQRRAEADELAVALRNLTGPRDSLEAERAKLLAPVTLRQSALSRLRKHTPRVQEIFSPDGGETARCPTCHGTLDDPPGVHPALPAGEAFRDTPCTVCHGGNGRALDADRAHHGLLAGTDAGPHSIRGRIDGLASLAPPERIKALEELRTLTGADPAGSDSAVSEPWAQWWSHAKAYFEPGESTREDADHPLLGVGIDPWAYSARGRTLRYVGSRECLRCHEVQHREHSRRWLATKFRSIERLVEEADPAPCLECHATGYDPATGLYAEPGVTCEACHGPGERYNEMMVVGQEFLAQGDELQGNALLDFSSRLARDAISRRTVPGDSGPINVCVRCHHPRRHLEGGPGSLERSAEPAAAVGGQS